MKIFSASIRFIFCLRFEHQVKKEQYSSNNRITLSYSNRSKTSLYSLYSNCRNRGAMLRNVIAVFFLSSLAIGNFNPFDRQWDEDKQAVCVDKCEDYCHNCTEPVRCGEGQRKCGEKPIDPQMHQCSPDDICVPEECECKNSFFNFNNFNILICFKIIVTLCLLTLTTQLIFPKVTILTPMVIAVNVFALLNVQATKSNVVKSKPLLVAYKTTSVFTKGLMKTMSFVMDFVQ